MIKETNFKDIRRNFILASVILILFLIYGGRIEINKILLFDLSGENWAIFSSSIDILILLFLFFFYTLVRYLIYGNAIINTNKYGNIKFQKLIDKIQEFRMFDNNNIGPFSKITVASGKDIFDITKAYFSFNKSLITFDYITNKNRTGVFLVKDIGNISNVIIKEKIVTFEFYYLKNKCGASLIFLDDKYDFLKRYILNPYDIIFNKEFSDVIWPLILIPVIITLLLIKMFQYFC